jgi:hypothetical protein
LNEAGNKNPMKKAVTLAENDCSLEQAYISVTMAEQLASQKTSFSTHFQVLNKI